MTRPSARTTVAPVTYSAVTPYLTHRIPPELQATFPPIVDISRLAGSGGYMRPCSFAARSRLVDLEPGEPLEAHHDGIITCSGPQAFVPRPDQSGRFGPDI